MSEERSLWAWGLRSEEPTEPQQERLATLAGAFIRGDTQPRPSPAVGTISVPDSRIEVPAALESIVSLANRARAAHTYGRGYPDLVRGFAGDFGAAPDAVASPSTEAELERVIEWCEQMGFAAIPYGGGTNVVGGIEPRLPSAFPGSVTIDMSCFSGVREIDEQSRLARIGAGSTGPALEQELAASGLTLRHFPQSFAFSTLGGWLATRAGGHFATRYTHIDDLTSAIRMVTPRGVWEQLSCPSSGAGPRPDRLVLGSEGILGLITEAWMRVRPRPTHRASASVRFGDFESGVGATQAIAQSRLYPDNCRLLDGNEARLHQVSFDGSTVLVLGFEGTEPVDSLMEAAVAMVQDHGGTVFGDIRRWTVGDERERAEDEATWRRAFLRGPYLLNVAVSIGLLVDTFETAVSWKGFPGLHERVMSAAHDVLDRECGGGLVACRLTHIYPEGPAPYYTAIARSQPGGELPQWLAVKEAITDAICDSGGTVTHHHAVGRVHMPWYRRERPALFGAALAGVKRAVDPAGILDPGVLIDE